MEDKIEKYCNEYGEPAEEISCAEELFLREYARFLRLNPRIREFTCFDFSPLEYFNVTEYFGYEAGQDIIFNSKKWPREVQYGEAFDKTIERYRLQHVINAIGSDKLSKIVEEMIDDKDLNLFDRISKALDYDVATIFASVEKLRPEQVKPGSAEQARFERLRKWRLSNLSGKVLRRAERMIDLEELCSRPVLIDFSKKERVEIIKMIYAMSDDEFVYNCDGIACFLANFILHETEWSFKEILPVAVYLVTETPIREPKTEAASNLSWFCSEIIERCYKILPNVRTVQKHYGDLLYRIYWPRIGSLWPLLHWEEIKFKEESRREDIEEAANAVLSLVDIKKRNAEVAAYVKAFAKNEVSYHRENENRDLFYCGFRHQLETYPVKKQVDMIFEQTTEWERGDFLDCPDTVEEAKAILERVFRDYKEYPFGEVQFWARLFGLVGSQNVEGVGKCILNYLVEHLDECGGVGNDEGGAGGVVGDEAEDEDEAGDGGEDGNVDGSEDEAEASSDDEECVRLMNELFDKACLGVSEDDELEPLAKLGEKIYAYGGSDEEKMKKSYTYAEMRAKTMDFQSKEIAPMFEKAYNVKIGKEEK